MKLANLKIGTRLAIGFCAVLLLVGASAMAGVWRLGELGTIIDRIVSQDAAKLVLAEQWEKNIAVNLVRTHNSMQILDGVVVEGLKRDMDATSGRISELQKQIETVAAGCEGIEKVETELVWTPAWSPELMSEDAKFILGY